MLTKTIIKLLNSYKLEAWICGGTARDIYLGRPIYSYDVAVNATLSDLREKVKNRIVSTDTRNTSLTIKYNDAIFNLFPLKKIKLVNTYHTYLFTNDVKEDSNHRDFTINSLYYNPLTNMWLDFHNGRKDADSKIIRFVGDANTRILESKIRLLRAPILCGMLSTAEAPWFLDYLAKIHIRYNYLKLMSISTKQLHEEIIKIFTRCDNPSLVFGQLKLIDILSIALPELYHCIGIEQSNKAKNLDLYTHIMYALDSIPINKDNSLTLRLAALLHDIGKPQTQIYTDTGLHFYGHEHTGAFLSEKILYRWGFTKDTVSTVSKLISNHLFEASPRISDAALKRLIARVGTRHIHTLLDLRMADRVGTGRKNMNMRKINQLRDRINKHLSNLKSVEFRLNISDLELKKILSKVTEFTPKVLTNVKKYLENKVLYGKLLNKHKNLKKVLYKVLSIKCPLDKAHLFKTWAELQTGTADKFQDGGLKCGVYCNFLCEPQAINDNTPTGK